MYCGECGFKLEEGSLFCGECGSKVSKIEENKGTDININSSNNKIPKKKSMSKLKKIILICILGVLVVLFAIFQLLKNYYSPEHVAGEYFSAIAEKDMNKLYQYLNLDGDTTFASKEIFKKSSDLLETEEIQNYTVEEAVYNDSKLSARVTVYYMLEGNNSESSTVVLLTKEKKKKFLFFDSWVVSNNQSGLIAKDYSVTVPKGAKVVVDGIKLENKYLDKELSDEEDDVYTIPVIFRKETSIKTTLKNGIIISNEVTPSNAYNYTVKLSVSNLDDKSVDKLEEKVEESLTTIYKGIVEKKSFDDIKSSFEFTGADLEDLKDAYSVVFSSLDSSGDELKEIDFTAIDLTAVSMDDGLLYVRAKINYNYTIEYKKLFSEERETKSSKEYTYVTLYYDYVDGDYKLVDAQRLMSYFSKY